MFNNYIFDNILERYRIEPRATAYEHWLVVYDKIEKKYITEIKNPKKYARFKNSDLAYIYLKKLREDCINNIQNKTKGDR